MLKDFVNDEMPLFHNVGFEEATGSEKRIIHFFNKDNEKLRESDVTEVKFVARTFNGWDTSVWAR